MAEAPAPPQPEPGLTAEDVEEAEAEVLRLRSLLEESESPQ